METEYSITTKISPTAKPEISLILSAVFDSNVNF